MNKIAKALDEKLRTLDPKRAEHLETIVRDAIAKIDAHAGSDDWPEGYFEEVLGSFADEPLERAPQGELPKRDEWQCLIS